MRRNKNKKSTKILSSAAANGDCVDFIQDVSTGEFAVERLKEENDRLKVELNELKKINRKLEEEREHDKQLLMKLDALSRQGNTDNADLQNIFVDVLEQREEILQIYDLVKSNMSAMTPIKSGIASGLCDRCASVVLDDFCDDPTSNISLSTAVACEDDVLGTEHRGVVSSPKIVLFNNGRAISINSNHELSAGYSQLPGPNDEDNDALLGATAAAGSYSDHERPSSEFGRVIPDSSQFSSRGAHARIVKECPLCGCGGFDSIDELTFHVDSHFGDQFDETD